MALKDFNSIRKSYNAFHKKNFTNFPFMKHLPFLKKFLAKSEMYKRKPKKKQIEKNSPRVSSETPQLDALECDENSEKNYKDSTLKNCDDMRKLGTEDSTMALGTEDKKIKEICRLKIVRNSHENSPMVFQESDRIGKNIQEKMKAFFQVFLLKISELSDEKFEVFVNDTRQLSKDFCELYELRPFHQHIHMCKHLF